MRLTIRFVIIHPLIEREIQMMKQEKTAPIVLTETETDHVAGGNNGDNGNHFGQEADPKLGEYPWTLPDFKGKAHQS
jgi:hypothetical protein